MGKKVIISVISDLATDQRVHRSASALHAEGWEVVLIGRVLPSSPAVDQRLYATKRFKLLFNKGPLFYMNYNIALFFFLMMKRTNALLSNDLDTLPANFLA